MVPQLPSLTVTKQKGKFSAGRVVSIAGWCLLSTRAQQWSGHRSGLQIIGGSFLNRNLGGSRLAHNAGGRPGLKTACCSRSSRATGAQSNARSKSDELKPTRSFRLHRHSGVYLVPSGLRIGPKADTGKIRDLLSLLLVA